MPLINSYALWNNKGGVGKSTIEYSDAKVHAFRKFRAPFSGKAVHTFPEQSAVI